MATDGPTPAPCDPEIFENGEVVHIADRVSSNLLEGWVRAVAALSHQSVDWHFVGGRGVIKALGDIEKVKETVALLMPVLDKLREENLASFRV